MSFESAPKKEGNEALKQNLNSLVEIFQLNEREGKYDSNDKNVIEIGRIIQKHTESVESGYNRIGDPEGFLEDLHVSCERALEAAVDDDEKEKIREMFAHVDIL